MGVIDAFGFPKRAVANGDANFFLQFTAQGLLHRFTCFEFATRKFPIACVHLANRSRGEQERAVVLDQHTHGHLHQAAIVVARLICVDHAHFSRVHGLRQGQRIQACLPA